MTGQAGSALSPANHDSLTALTTKKRRRMQTWASAPNLSGKIQLIEAICLCFVSCILQRPPTSQLCAFAFLSLVAGLITVAETRPQS